MGQGITRYDSVFFYAGFISLFWSCFHYPLHPSAGELTKQSSAPNPVQKDFHCYRGWYRTRMLLCCNLENKAYQSNFNLIKILLIIHKPLVQISVISITQLRFKGAD